MSKLERDALVHTNHVLRQQLVEYKLKSHHETSKDVLYSFLRELIDHYKSHVKNHSYALGNFYIEDKRHKWYTFPDEYAVCVEDLWYGRRESFTFPFANESCEVMLHANLLQDGMPLVVFRIGDEIMAIKKRQAWTTYLHLFKFQPILHGMRCNAQLVDEYLRGIDRGYNVSIGSELLEELASIWLGREPRVPANKLIVDGTSLINLLELVRTQPDAKCYFLLTGQGVLFAYIQVNDEHGNVLLVVPIGSVEE